MKNLEQTLAKTLLEQYNFCERTAQRQKAKPFDDSEYSFLLGEKIALKSIATAIWGQDIAGQIPLDFIKTLEKIASAKPQSNLVEVSRFEAFALYKHFSAKSIESMQAGYSGASESYSNKAKKWLDLAVQIEQANADDINKNLV